MQRELTGGLPKLVKNELMGGHTKKWLSGCSWMVTAPKVVGFDGQKQKQNKSHFMSLEHTE